MQSWLLFLLSIAPLAEAASAGGQEPIMPCDAVATHVKSVAADPRAVKRPHGQDYDDYDALLAPILGLPPPELADGDLWAKAIKLLGGDQDTVVEVQHVDGPVWRSVQVAGTAHCQTERFFSVRPDGGLSAIDTPAVFGDLCWSSYRQVGRVGGRPALIEQEIREHPLLGVDVEITPWTSSERTTCQVAIRFNDAFHVTERFCKDRSVCLAAEPLAPKLAEALARFNDGTTLAAIAPPPSQQAQALSTRLVNAKEGFESGRLGNAELPTYGAKPRTKYPTYAGSPQVTLIALAGQTLIARVGIGGIGWRELGDYLITLYSGDGDGLAPVASFVVERQNTGLRSVTTSVPQPHGTARQFIPFARSARLPHEFSHIPSLGNQT
jgi:hypothetical protein